MKVSNGNNKLTTNMSEINVTPLVDVMLVLLIIFMVTAPMMQSGIEINLPSAETRANPSAGGLVLTITKDRYIHLDSQVINIFLLESQVKNFFAGKEKKTVFIKADKDVPYGYVVDVMDILKKSGIQNVGLVVDQKLKEKK